jgi:hypothetical protein
MEKDGNGSEKRDAAFDPRIDCDPAALINKDSGLLFCAQPHWVPEYLVQLVNNVPFGFPIWLPTCCVSALVICLRQNSSSGWSEMLLYNFTISRPPLLDGIEFRCEPRGALPWPLEIRAGKIVSVFRRVSNAD